MKGLYTHTVLNSVVVAWVIHRFLRSLSTDPGMAFAYFCVAALLLLSFPGYVDRQFNEGQ